MDRSPTGIALAGDDQAHRILMERLVDLVLGDGDDLHTRRSFVGDGAGRPFLDLTRRPARAPAPSGRPRYRSQRLGARPLGYAAVLVEAAVDLAGRAEVVVVLADQDGDLSRAARLPDAREALCQRGLSAVALGICDPIAEGWLVALLAATRADRARVLASRLGFDPARHPEQLCGQPPSARRHAKRALAFLLAPGGVDLMAFSADTPGADQTGPALAAAPLVREALRQLEDCGLSDFVTELERILPPVSP